MTRAPAEDRPFWLKLLLLALAGAMICCFVMLGNWQMRRLDWKVALIERIETRAFAAPQAPPSGNITEDQHSYLRLQLEGTFLHEKTLLVKAVTDLGLGFWVMTPLVSDPLTVWVNRGFVPSKLKSSPDQWKQPLGRQRVVGLLRVSVPDGTLLETNNPSKNLWYSRDVPAMSQAVQLPDAAAYFIDQENNSGLNEAVKAWPRAGLTVVKFRNPHLSYALTWYAMALLFFGALVYVVRRR